ncbi:MAG: Asp-tRNA(Asn)/Glu-tRNA(Gln) amidotransferase subunit GatA [Myxococcota bacterium]|nr:Asp-tRNA(Asn)/Glu-tRNA(Gln) amidotransferase subunit GatA [Myxococcota bacterium]
MTEILDTLASQRDALATGRVSSRELVQASLDRSEACSDLNLVVGTRAEAALADADASDARRAAGELRGALDGVPILLKDNMIVRGEPAQCGSQILDGFVAPYNGGVSDKLDEAGAVVVGRANMDEFAMGSSTENSTHGVSHNPWDPERACGGSSGGSAGAVAAGVTAISLGSDTGGSIRQPAAFCGVVGMKPTYGRVSRWGLVAFASSLDQIGPCAHSARDCALVLEAISGHDPRDSTSIPQAAPKLESALDGDVSGMVIGLPREYFETEGADPRVLESVREAVAELERAGAKTREVSLPHTTYGIAAYYLIATAEASSNLARFDGVRYGHRAEGVSDLADLYQRTRSEGFGDEVKRRIVLGTYVLSAGYYDAYYRKAQKVRTLLRRDFDQAFESCDVIATPTTPEVAFKLGEKGDDPLKMYLSDVYTVTAPLAGIPGVSLPCGEVDGLPTGLQLLGPALGEAPVLRVADAYQRLTDHHEMRPGGLA